ncbi:MAG: ParB/RepB/Spo0J family partition protein [Candidatus Bathyarchaeota archaeon]|nr:ParB/RepB/Spo0J family partition protein [Candidatus Bathyarchaeota archaeon]MDH5746433.1 ParB/RepB/Spo0J family partition protein [Candidatus Bathyarchaeota archaeon]
MSEIVKKIELKKIHPSKLNPRLEINVGRLNELAASILEVGLLEPIIVRPVNDEYEVVVGERRYRASQQAGLEKVLVIVREYSDDEVAQLNLIENIQREELNAIEKGKVCKYLLENCPEKYPSRSAVAEKIGVSNNVVSLWLRAVEVVPQEAQKYVAPSTISGQVPEGKIDYLTAVKVGRSVEKPEKRVEVIKKLAEKRLPVKERSQIIKKIAREPEKPIEEVIDEVTEAPCELRFTADDKEPLLDGTKTQTSRINVPDPKVKVGAIVHAAIWEPHIADLRITSIERKKARYFDEEDAKREGGYTLEEFKKKWEETHGEWDENQLFYVIHFEKVK